MTFDVTVTLGTLAIGRLVLHVYGSLVTVELKTGGYVEAYHSDWKHFLVFKTDKMSLEENIKAKSHSSGKNDPAATDLDYYSKPENYEGSNLQSFKRFQAAKDKEEKSKQVRIQSYCLCT